MVIKSKSNKKSVVSTKEANQEANQEAHPEVKADKETLSRNEVRLDDSIALVSSPQPQQAPIIEPSKVLRPTLRRNGISEADQYITMYTIKNEVFFLQMCAWITTILCVLTKTALAAVFTSFLGLCYNWEGGSRFMKALGAVWREPGQASYSNLQVAMFPSSESDKSYQMTFKLTEANYVSAAVLFEVTYPLLLRNPAITLLTMFGMFIIYHLLSILHDFLMDIIGVMNARLLGRTLPQEPAPQPQLA